MPSAPAAPGRAARGSSSLLLFAIPSFIWGTTWLAIKFQLGAVAPEVSVVWRFALAATLLLGWCLVRGIPLPSTPGEHARLAVLGLLLFGLNYVLVYRSEQLLTSGLVGVLFAFLVFWNLLGARIFFGTPAPPALVLGATLGVAGVALLFWPEVASLRDGPGRGLGVVFALAGTVVASAGNLWSQHLFARGVAVVPGTGVAMAWAAAALALYCAVAGVPFSFEARPGYVLSLAYLALFGSVVAFVSFLTLLQRAGAGPAGYTAAVTPVVAMLASTLFEGYRWSAGGLAGMALVMAGTVLVLRAKERAARAPAAPGRGPAPRGA